MEELQTPEHRSFAHNLLGRKRSMDFDTMFMSPVQMTMAGVITLAPRTDGLLLQHKESKWWCGFIIARLRRLEWWLSVAIIARFRRLGEELVRRYLQF